MSISNANNHDESFLDFQEDINIQDIIGLCINRWYWFVISLILCTGIAIGYLMITPPVFSRSASLLIKEDSKNAPSSINEELNNVGNLGLFAQNTNVNNEMVYIKSPDLILQVVKRLHLDINYQVDGTMHRNTIYGNNLPIQVEFENMHYDTQATFTLQQHANGTATLSDFVLNGKEQHCKPIIAPVNTIISTPVGKLKWTKNQEDTYKPIYVSKTPLMAAMKSCGSRLEVSRNDKQSTIIDIEYKDVSPARAEDFLNTLIDVYNESWVKDKNKIAVSTSKFINDRLQVIEQELGNVDSNISSYKSNNLIPDMEESSRMYMNTANQANMQITDLNNQLYMAQYVRQHMSSKANKHQLLPANSGINNAAIEKQISDYNEKMLERNSLVANSSVENPLVADLDKRLGQMRLSIIKSIDNQISTLNAQIKGMQHIEGTSTSRIARNPKQAKYLLSVERQQKVKESLYLFLLQKREENEISQAFTAYNTRVVVSPTGDMTPTSPNRKNILIGALLVSFLLPIAGIYVIENLNTKVRGRKDLESLTAPIVGEIPHYNSKKDKSKEDYKILVKAGNRNVINEAFRVARTNLEFMTNANQGNRVIMFTSANPGSGKTFLAMNMASSFAIKNKKVICIDLDLRRASLSQYVGSPDTGMANYLNYEIENWREMIKPVNGYENIDVVPVGNIPPNPTELLFSKRLKQFIDILRLEYDYVFIDCPPAEVVADASIIAKYASTTIFVIRAGLFERDMLQQVEYYYTEKKFPHLGVLLNDTQMAKKYRGYHRYSYQYGYHAYGSESYTGYAS